jgi:hypothetical protein
MFTLGPNGLERVRGKKQPLNPRLKLFLLQELQAVRIAVNGQKCRPGRQVQRFQRPLHLKVGEQLYRAVGKRLKLKNQLLHPVCAKV